MEDIFVPFVTEAFVDGYALHAETLTPKARKALNIILDLVRRYAVFLSPSESYNIFDFAESIGGLEGLRTKLFLRRDRLWMRYDRRSRNWTRKVAQITPADRLVDSAKEAFSKVHRVEEASKDLKAQRNAVAAASTAFLLHTLQEHEDLESEARALASAALTDAAAEGTTAAQAFVAQYGGKQVPDLVDLYYKNLQSLQSINAYWATAPQAVIDQVNGLAGDLALSLTSLMNDGASEEELEKAVTSALSTGDGAAFYLDQAIHAAFVRAQQTVYQKQGVAQYSWISVGDSRVCAACLADEAGSPYPVDSSIIPPEHSGCRCWIEPYS